jgi:hypothetical protein
MSRLVPLLEFNHVGGFDSDVGSAVDDLLTPGDLEEESHDR